ncbi:MAG: YbjN domain-containing protein [Pseudomonadota bacterium]
MTTLVKLKDIADFLTEGDWHYNVRDDKAFSMGVQGDNATFEVFVEFHEENDVIVIETTFPFRVPENKRTLVSELLARINLGRFHGCCQMDLTNGFVCYHTAMPIDNSPFNKDIFERLLQTSMNMSDWTYPAFMSVIYGGMSPEEALKLVETETEP